MKLLIIHQYFATPNEPGGTRHFELAANAVRRGRQCAVVTSNLNFSTGRSVVAGRGLVQEQECAGVQILRAYTYPSLHKSFTWRVVSFLSFMLTSVWASLRVRDVDVVMGTSPPLFQALSAWFVAAVRRKPFLLEIRDLWPEFAIDIGVLKSPTLIRLSRLLERFLYRRATHLLVNSPAYRDYLIEHGVPAEKISFVANGVDPDMFPADVDGETIRRELGLGDRFVVTYAGAMGMANDLGVALDAANLLRDDARIHFLFVGGGKEETNLRRRAEELKLPNITFAGSRNKNDMPAILAASDVCLATLRDIPMFRTTYPNKVFDYMAAGRPTVLAIDGVIRQVVDAAEGGVFVPPGDARALANAVCALADDPATARRLGDQARRYVAAHFNRHTQADVFLTLIDDLVDGAAAPVYEPDVSQVRQTCV